MRKQETFCSSVNCTSSRAEERELRSDEGVDEQHKIGLITEKSICAPSQEKAACGLNYSSGLFGFAFKSENCSY